MGRSMYVVHVPVHVLVLVHSPFLFLVYGYVYRTPAAHGQDNRLTFPFQL